jgi:NTP pyrophosphatase (non-canonical NTP hydrolase)
LTAEQLAELKPLAAVIETAITETPIRLGTDDWGTVLAANVLAAVATYMGRTLGPDAKILAEVQAERTRQDAKWGEQNGHDFEWVSIITEEIGEAAQAANEANFQSSKTRGDYSHLRVELVQVAAVAVAWIGAIDRRAAKEADR